MGQNEAQIFYTDHESEQAKRVNSTNPLPVFVGNLPNNYPDSALSTIHTTTVTLTTADTAYKLPATEQADRRSIILYNGSDTDIYYGGSNVTTSNGILLASGAEVSLDISSGLYAVCSEDNKTINILELK